MAQLLSDRPTHEPVSYWKRIVGFVFDLIVVVPIALLFGWLAGGILSYIVAWSIGLAYFVFLNANGGTFGKTFMGLRLRRDQEGGRNIGYRAAFVRYVVAYASAFALFIGYLWAIWDAKGQTWHDKAAGSVVVAPPLSRTHNMDVRKRRQAMRLRNYWRPGFNR